MRASSTVWRTALAAVVSLTAFSALAQDITGTISGSVTDPSGAAVVKAKVTVRAVDKGLIARSLETNSEGFYSAALLPVGNYSVTIEAPGFRRAVQAGIALSATQKYTADFKLQIGETTAEITVEAEANQVELQTAQSSTQVSGTQVRELALNNRHFAQLVALQPGVSSNLSDQIYVGTTNPTGGNNTVGMAINGTRQSQNNWTVDGADNVDRGSNITIQQYPSVDAIEEIKIVRSPYSAEFGRAGGGQVNVITKSGTNAVHGSAYEFFRNNVLNANTYFSNLNGQPRQVLRYNDFGYTLGGPVYIPKVYDGRNKTFFFFSEEFRRVINYTGTTVQLPTADERKGVFTNPVCVEVTGAACTQTSTTIANINPVAQSYIKDIFSKLPLPTNGNNLYTVARGVFNARQEIIKVDHNFSEKLALSVRFLHDSIPTIEPGGLFQGNYLPGVATTQTNAPGRSLVVRATSPLSPTLYNEVSWAWSRGAIVSDPTGLAAKANSPDINPTLVYKGNPVRVPSLVFSGLNSVNSYGHYDNFSYNHSFADNISKVFRLHTLKFGGTFYLYRKNENLLADNTGSFTFGTSPRPSSATTVQQSWANFLLGNVSTFTQASADLTADIRAKSFEFYVQDDYRVRPNLTLNFGLRYSNFRQPTDANGLLTNFVPGLFDKSRAYQINPADGNRIAGTGDPLNGVVVGGTNSPFGDQVARTNNRNFAPRVGLAWDPFNTGKTSVRAGYGMFYDATLVGSLEQNIGVNPTSTFTSLNIANTRLENPAAASPTVSLAPATLRTWDPGYKDPYIQQWNFDIQRQFPLDTLFTVGYVGTKGTHLIGIVDINQVRPGVAAAAGLVPASGYINSAVRPRLNYLRPYAGYNAINAILSAFNSNYHALQVSLNKRFAKTGALGFAYTFSKNLTDNGSDRSNAPQNTFDYRSGEYGLATLDRRHVLTASWVYPLPFFKNSHAPIAYVLGGWELSGIATWNTGTPFTVTSSLGNDPGGMGSANNATSAAGVRPDAISDPYAGSDIGTIYKWFNTAAFAEVPKGQYRPGNSGRSVIEAPGISKVDFSIFKDFPLRERVKIQLRGEAFNVFNHANFNAPTAALGNANFGKILGTRDPRLLQVAAKLLF